MDTMIALLEEIRDLLSEMNEKIDEIRGDGAYNSISDICDKIDEVKGNGLYDSISDVCDKLDTLDTTIDLK